MLKITQKVKVRNTHWICKHSYWISTFFLTWYLW